MNQVPLLILHFFEDSQLRFFGLDRSATEGEDPVFISDLNANLAASLVPKPSVSLPDGRHQWQASRGRCLNREVFSKPQIRFKDPAMLKRGDGVLKPLLNNMTAAEGR
jgi:hypothetical protein